MNLTIVIPSYNNLEYLKLCYKSIRDANKNVKLILIDDGSSDGTSDYLKALSTTDENLQFFTSDKRIGHTHWYDIGFSKATTDYIGIVHSDMIVPPNFFDVLESYLTKNDVVSAKCIEPPLHPPGPEKIIKDFGMYPSEFKSKQFFEFVNIESESSKGKTTPALFAPWFIHKETYYTLIGGHDKQFAPYGWEDADIFVRMMKVGLTPVQVQSLLVYHFTQRGHRWSAGTVGKAHDDYNLQMYLTQTRFMNKWGTLDWKDENHTPKKIPLHYRQLKIKNYKYGNNPYEYVNMFFNKVVTDNAVLYDDGKNLPISYEVVLDYHMFYDQTELQMFLQQLPFIIEETDVGDYEFGGIIISIYNKDELTSRVL